MPPVLKCGCYGELVKDAESWISIGLMNTKEDIKGDTYKDYTLNDHECNPLTV